MTAGAGGNGCPRILAGIQKNSKTWRKELKLYPSEANLDMWLFQIPNGRSSAGDKLDEINLLPVGMEIKIEDKGRIQTAVFSGSKPIFNDSGDSFKFTSPGVFYISTTRGDNESRYRRAYVSCQVKIREEHMGLVRDWTASPSQAATSAAVPVSA